MKEEFKTVSEQDEIRYMKVRLVRLASEEWHKSIENVADLFTQNDVFHYISVGYGIFHVEGDYAVLEDIKEYLLNKGIDVDD